jgi:hypothetical protein
MIYSGEVCLGSCGEAIEEWSGHATNAQDQKRVGALILPIISAPVFCILMLEGVSANEFWYQTSLKMTLPSINFIVVPSCPCVHKLILC